MAARNRTWTPDVVRQKIRTSMLVNRLQKHVDGKIEMTSAQVKSAEILLSKTLPSLSQQELQIGGDLTVNDISDKPLTTEQWAAEADNLGTATGSSSPTH